MQYKARPDSLLSVLTQPGVYVRGLIKQLPRLQERSSAGTALGWSQVELIDQQALNRAMFPSFSRQLTGTFDLF